MTYDLFQNAFIAVIVALAAVMMFRRLFPQTARKLTGRKAAAPKASGGCDSGCSSCNGCSTLKFDIPKPD
ncbi:hypothetical protein PQU92_09930 [Asticcacaulis sp. BYS171W]|uniref:FeoB-associated Cys-rich membrane protein n=1 Tax=Asticcacaulis aquaticus TaxID=2984212 RepID=A0ABT5HU52_9CAUL|nr:DUF6587 family protein [Asticcacaulis aquaticus]MDC7683596.1 hypothetical protein [Asticcacaulis aquaticus]